MDKKIIFSGKLDLSEQLGANGTHEDIRRWER